jgi:sigma-B regulation protein RsbU (phosphoserine phosphatase)
MTPKPLLLHLTESAPESLRCQIARHLRAGIASGEFPEGCPLPPAHRVARQHRVSPREVRRAMQELAGEGLLVEGGDAAFSVAPLSARQRRALAEHRVFDEVQEKGLSKRELQITRDIQRRLLPPTLVETGSITVASRWRPAGIVAGDFYDVLRHPDGSAGIVVADVAGKGFGASLLMASVKATIPFVAAESSVADTVRALNRRLHDELARGQFVALTYARVSPDGETVEIANAGMPDPIVVRNDGPAVPIEVPGERLPLGIRPEVVYTSVTCRLERASRLLFYSDGLPEALTPSGEPLGYERLGTLLERSMASRADLPAIEAWLDGVLDQVERATRPGLDDDWTAVAVERRREEAT